MPNFIHCNLPQGSDAWLGARVGVLTASRVKPIMSRIKKPWNCAEDITGGALTLLNTLTKENQTGEVKQFTSEACDWGNRFEDEAIELFEDYSLCHVERTGLILLDGCDYIGASVDGLIGDNQTAEVKCPYRSSVHVGYREPKKVLSAYKAQIQLQLLVTERDLCQFMSYDPRIDERGGFAHLRLIMHEFKRDEEYIKIMRERLTIFTEELDRRLTA